MYGAKGIAPSWAGIRSLCLVQLGLNGNVVNASPCSLASTQAVQRAVQQFGMPIKKSASRIAFRNPVFLGRALDQLTFALWINSGDSAAYSF